MEAVSDRARRELHERATETWGPEAADTLMASLPPAGYADLATKADLAVLRSDLTVVEATLTALIRSEVARLSQQYASVHERIAEVHEKIAEVHEKIADVQEAITGVHESIATQSRWFVVALAGTVIAVSALPQVLAASLG